MTKSFELTLPKLPADLVTFTEKNLHWKASFFVQCKVSFRLF